MSLPLYVTLEKAVGETPLACLEAYRANHPELDGVPLAYAGRLDPMASGKLLILIGETCKNQTAWHGLDKAYDFSILFGIESDTHDVLGRLTTSPTPPNLEATTISPILDSLIGEVTLPYPHFSSKTIHGKALHTWTLEGRLDEITIPTKVSTIYQLSLAHLEKIHRQRMVEHALAKINTIPPVTDERKALGNDFRRVDVRADWEELGSAGNLPTHYQIATFKCIASSGTYMRTLASVFAKKLSTIGLAWHINRTHIGKYDNQTSRWHVEY